MPIGPFQKTVWHFFNSREKFSMVCGPISTILKSGGIFSINTVLVLVSALISLATITSTGSNKHTPFLVAFSIRPTAVPSLSASTNDRPVSYDLAFRKVAAIPPPIRRQSTLLIVFSKRPILSLTLAPPISSAKG